MNFAERDFTPATTIRARRRRRWIATGIVAVLLLGGCAIAAYRYFRVCGDCSPILCTAPCTLPTFSQVSEPEWPNAGA